MFNVPFKDRKPTLTLVRGDGTCCFAKKTIRVYEKPSPLLEIFLRQSKSSKRVELPLAEQMNHAFKF